jgi:hypothetical protein
MIFCLSEPPRLREATGRLTGKDERCTLVAGILFDVNS